LVFCDEWLLCVPSSIRLFSFWPQIALQWLHEYWWLHECCMGLILGRKSGYESLFRIKRLRPAIKGISCVRRVRLRSFQCQSVLHWFSLTCGCSCVRSYRAFWNLCLQIAM
jgi:hypothetical protein